MKLYLAVAVLMLAFVAYTEAQEDNIGQRLSEFGKKISDISTNLADRAKNMFEQVHNSDFAVESRQLIQDQWEKMMTKLKGLSQ